MRAIAAPAAPAAMQHGMHGARHAPAMIALHWLMLQLVLLAYLCIELRVLFERGTPEREFMRAAHASIGLTILVFALLRLAIRWRVGVPPVAVIQPAWRRLAARASHALLYLLMIGMPLAGWLLLSLRGDPIPYFGLDLPPLAAENEVLAKRLRAWHGNAGRAGYLLIGLHAAAALAHHYLWRDGTLRRMLPRPSGRGA